MGKEEEERRVLFCCCGDEDETMGLGGEMAKWSRCGDVWMLEGDLGMGKTCFARGFIRYVMGSETVVPSPTFSLVQGYEGGGRKLFHYDLYRMSREDSLYDLGWEEGLLAGESLVEWPERMDLRGCVRDYWRVLWQEEGEGRRIEVWRRGEEREEEGRVLALEGINFLR